MARSLAGKPNVVAPGGNYPFGRVKDNPGDHTGTNANENLFGDLIQFFEKLMSLGGVTANGQPENSSSGFQYITALLNTVLNTIGMGAGNAIDYSGDLQSLTQPGFYFAELAASNKPVATTGDVVFFKFSINEQFLVFLSSNGKFYYNIKTGFPSAWLGWTCLNDVASNKVDKGGDSMTGPLAMGGNKVTGVADGTSGNDAVNRSQLDAEATARANADSSEATARANADSSEATTRASNDTTLQNEINNIKPKRVAEITLTVTGASPQSIDTTSLPNCIIGFWATIAFSATGNDVPLLTYIMSDDSYATNIFRESDPGYFSSANIAEISVFCPLGYGNTGKFLLGNYFGTTGTAIIKISRYV